MQQEFWPSEKQLALPLNFPVRHMVVKTFTELNADDWFKRREEDREENQRNYRR